MKKNVVIFLEPGEVLIPTVKVRFAIERALGVKSFPVAEHPVRSMFDLARAQETAAERALRAIRKRFPELDCRDPLTVAQVKAICDDIGLDLEMREAKPLPKFANKEEMTAWIASRLSNKTESTHIGPLATKEEIIDGFALAGKNWRDILSRPTGAGKKYLAARLQPGKRGRVAGGKTASSLWNPVVFARLLIENNELNTGQVEARFKKTWSKWEAELLAEIGEL